MFLFKELIELWRSDNFLTQALNKSYTMLESTFQMFSASKTSLRESDEGEIGIDIYEMDRMVNQYEKEVRRKVLRHFAITGNVNIMSGLVLTSIVIDIERIGDYTKNIRDLAIIHPKRLECGSFDGDVSRIETAVAGMFERGIPAFKASDKEAARAIIEENRWIIKRCDEIVDAFVREEERTLSSGDAVSAALYVRYLKRIAAHLRNTISSIVNPFEAIGFLEEEGEEA
jgi:phosphate uptake regulator